MIQITYEKSTEMQKTDKKNILLKYGWEKGSSLFLKQI